MTLLLIVIRLVHMKILYPLSGLALCLLFTSCVTPTGSKSPIPPLNSKGDVYKTEGETDFLIYGTAIGKKKMLMVYLGFSDTKPAHETEERGRNMFGEGKFQAMFKKQSAGKLTMTVEHVHGWRSLPNPRDDYGTKTTEAHRALFVDVFAQYPEIDFRKYDYIAAHIPGLGNTAFGERPDIAIPYRGGKITLALNIGSQNYLVLAHETGHLMGLPDLYSYGGAPGRKNPIGSWDVMSQASSSSGFIGWHRHKFKWLDADREAYLPSGTHTLTVHPLDADSGLALIVVPRDDVDSPSKVFVVEIARSIKIKGEGMTQPGGVLIYSVDASVANGHNAMVVYPRVDDEVAPYRVGDRFEHKDAPMTVEVLKSHPNGSYDILLSVIP